MDESTIRADAPLVTMVNVFTVEPENQRLLVERWQRRHRRGDPSPAGFRLGKHPPEPRRHEGCELRAMGNSGSTHRDAPKPRSPQAPT